MLHGEEDVPVLLAHVVDLHDVRVVEQRLQPRLVEEHAPVLVVPAHVAEDALDDDELGDAGERARAALARQEHLAHAAVREAAQQRVAAEATLLLGQRLRRRAQRGGRRGRVLGLVDRVGGAVDEQTVDGGRRVAKVVGRRGLRGGWPRA
ncbi:MAG: hypothetical protein A2138_26495 [Deltaproteobacteria bacterium RBG_16_71_12]|nr:MAG: hypothetical protein A2138_26495 [Deltaproteobacteria bacterium RBG_16_71_12]